MIAGVMDVSILEIINGSNLNEEILEGTALFLLSFLMLLPLTLPSTSECTYYTNFPLTLFILHSMTSTHINLTNFLSKPNHSSANFSTTYTISTKLSINIGESSSSMIIIDWRRVFINTWEIIGCIEE